MRKYIALVLALVCVLALVGCKTINILGVLPEEGQNISEQDKNQLIYGEPQEPSNNDIVYSEGEPLDIESISKARAEEIALEQCKVNYDYVKTEFNPTEKRWSVEFWENIGKVPTQTILIDTEGNVLEIRYAE